MTTPTFSDLARRLDAVERQNRRLRRWGGALLLLALSLGTAAMAREERVPEVLRARRFEAVGEDGKPYASLSVWPGEGGALILTRKDSRTMAQLRVIEQGKAGLFLMDEEGQRVGLGMSRILFIKGPAIRAELGIDDEGGGRLLFNDEDGKNTWKVPE